MAIKVHDVVCVTDTDNDEEWLGYCAGFRLTADLLTNKCSNTYEPSNGESVLVLVQRRYGMGAVTIPVPLRFCS